jgi:hypothetical protein
LCFQIFRTSHELHGKNHDLKIKAFKFELGPKAELPQVGTLFGTQFPSLGIFISKKVGF